MKFWTELSVPRRKRLMLFVIAAAIVLVVLWLGRSVLGLYFVGMLLAYVLAPVVNVLQRGLEWVAEKIKFSFLYKHARAWSILLTYLILIAAIAGFVALVVPLIVQESGDLWARRVTIWEEVSSVARSALEQYQLLPTEIQGQIEQALTEASAFLTDVLQQAVQGTMVAITYTTSLVLAISIVPFWTFYLLRDFTEIRAAIKNMIPSIVRPDVRNIVLMFDKIFSAYLRGQIILCVVIGVMTTVVMSALGLEYALLLGIFAGILEVIPNIGPTIAAVPAILLALLQNPLLAVGTAIAANVIQRIENLFIVPRVLGESVDLHPVLMMVMLVVGIEIGGFPGLFLAPILTAMLRDLYRYFYQRFADDPMSPEQALVEVYSDAEFSVEI